MSTAADSITVSRLDGGSAKAHHAKALRVWLGLVALLIVAMILVGGATRLTNSGLSITEWKPATGVIPPLTESAWQEAFDAYQKIPEYLELKRGMSLEAFKTIYWWEWGHRFLGRLIGVAFLLPFLAFWIAGYIPRALLPRARRPVRARRIARRRRLVHGEERPRHARRCEPIPARSPSRHRRRHPRLHAVAYLRSWAGASGRHAVGLTRFGMDRGTVLALIYLQILAGGLVAGLDAGFGYNTWPLINGAFVPSGLGEAQPWVLNLFENPLTVQFDHRMLGYSVALATILQAGWLTLRRPAPELVTSAFILICLALLQATLGV